MRKPFQETLNWYGVSRKYAAKRLGISIHKMGCYCRLSEPLTLKNTVLYSKLNDLLAEDYKNGEIQKEWKEK